MLEAYGISDQGCVRSNNEDYFLLAPTLGLYLVADGMGGAQAGETASKLAADTVAEMMWRNGEPTPDSLQSAVEEANRRVMAAASSDPTLQGMGTTLVVAQAIQNELHIISVGDSRAYLYRDGRFSLITEDQTWVNEIGRPLGIPDATLKSHPMRHVLTMAIGVGGELRINHNSLTIEPGIQVLMCSDGLHGVLEHDFLSSVLSSGKSFEEKCHYLVEEARKAGGPDNITAVLIGTR